jgi:hypothetical protein
MSKSVQSEIFNAANAPGVFEKGGKYGQRGVDFQRYWAISRIIELTDSGAPDYLILFESLQDVLELDSSLAPTRARIYQLKMKATGEWTWKALTGLPAEPRKKGGSTGMTVPLPFSDSPIGKLASALAELDQIHGEGVFVSNGGCDTEMEQGSTAGTVKFCKFSDLSQKLRGQISPELAKLKKPIALSVLHLHKTELSLDDLDTHVTGKVYNLLVKAAPEHAGQSKAFADSLFATVSARGRRTDPPADFIALVAQCGYSKLDFLSAIKDLCTVPDRQVIVNDWLAMLRQEGMPIRDYTRLQLTLSQALQRRLGSGEDERGARHDAVKKWVADNPVGDSILTFLDSGVAAIKDQIPEAPRDEVQAALLLEGISQCQSQI